MQRIEIAAQYLLAGMRVVYGTVAQYQAEPARFAPHVITGIRHRIGSSGRRMVIVEIEREEGTWTRKSSQGFEATEPVTVAIPDGPFVVDADNPTDAEMAAAIERGLADGSLITWDDFKAQIDADDTEQGELSAATLYAEDSDDARELAAQDPEASVTVSQDEATPAEVTYRAGQRVIWTSSAPNPVSQHVNQPGRITGIQCDEAGRAMDIYYVTLDSKLHVTASAAQLRPEPREVRSLSASQAARLLGFWGHLPADHTLADANATLWAIKDEAAPFALGTMAGRSHSLSYAGDGVWTLVITGQRQDTDTDPGEGHSHGYAANH